ncbi:MAG: zinc-dependent metalloprotease, partial [Bdellovibrionota bacterium]
MTVDKAAFLSQEFLYGADLQYSSLYDDDMDLYNQSLAIGSIPARFRISDDELQLVADNRRLYPSDVNHPEQVLTRFKIYAQTETTLTISGANSSVFLAQVFEGSHTDTKGALVNPAGKPPRDHWIRSFDYDPKGNYLLQQSSIQMDDKKGSIAEIMESIYPRENTKPGKDFQKFQMDPEDPIGASDGPANRYRFLPGEKVFEGENEVAYSQHFDISTNEDGTPSHIDWYVHADKKLDDDTMLALKNAVEGWNRYFRKMKGIERDVVRFRGALPEGIHLGDPRYNVINWDSRRVAGAAYESQASDPATGKQSHSLIYMPAAWLQIGSDYWTGGRFSDRSSKPGKRLALTENTDMSEIASFLEENDGSESRDALASKGPLRVARIACMKSLQDVAATMASGKYSSQEIKTFSIQLLKQTLFHEVGHAMGLAHNFKGSLSFDRSNSKSLFSTSIMDYNDFEVERQAFDKLGDSTGPLLEYDRQAMSAIYNDSKDVAEKDETVPVCNDNEADSQSGGVDPLCSRYDIEHDPTHSVQTSIDRIQKDHLAGDVTLSEALRRIPGLVMSKDRIAQVKSFEDVISAADDITHAFIGSLGFYILPGKASLARTVTTNIKSLKAWSHEAPEGYDEKGMRDRAMEGVKLAVNFQLPKNVVKALQESEDEAMATLLTTPVMKSMKQDQAEKLVENLRMMLGLIVDLFERDPDQGLPKLRATILKNLARTKAPFYFDKEKNATVKADYENTAMDILQDATLDQKRPKIERAMAALALSSYDGRTYGETRITKVQAKLLKESQAATSNSAREVAEGLIKLLA